MKPPTSFRDQLKIEEDTILHVYPDHLGFLTIGTGRLVDERKGGGISQVESDYLLDNDIKGVTAAVNARWSWVPLLSERRQAVIYGMAFQMGVAGLATFTNTLRLVQTGNYVNAARNMLKSKWATQTPERALRMARQMETDFWH